MTAVDDAARPWVTALRWLEISIEALGVYQELAQQEWPLVPGDDYPTLQAIAEMSRRMAKSHYLLNAAHQAAKFLAALPGGVGGVSSPAQLGQLDEITDLRDVYEHWDEHASSFEDPAIAPPKRAGARFMARHPAIHPGAGTVQWLGPLDLVQLGADLAKARFATVECLRVALAQQDVTLRD